MVTDSHRACSAATIAAANSAGRPRCPGAPLPLLGGAVLIDSLTQRPDDTFPRCTFNSPRGREHGDIAQAALLNHAQQQTQFEAARLKVMESMMQQFRLHFRDPESIGKESTSADATAACITDLDSGVTFDAYF
ncbi:unnamed protein product [Schistocephalus solidus]|uniref:Uncharacterized protein n=1 Tax=Schistocephalus solidus TaxID=70667 RepID=A0A183SZC1_SCHSO|nr:unnamed protein product [Schistocephalus solidus]